MQQQIQKVNITDTVTRRYAIEHGSLYINGTFSLSIVQCLSVLFMYQVIEMEKGKNISNYVIALPSVKGHKTTKESINIVRLNINISRV